MSHIPVNNPGDYAFIRPNHIRAARGWLWWTLDDVEEKSGVTRGAVSKFETGTKNLSVKSRAVLAETFRRAGVELLPDGIRALTEALAIGSNREKA